MKPGRGAPESDRRTETALPLCASTELDGERAMQASEPVELLVCTKCRFGEEVAEDGTRPGTVLYERLAAGGLDGVTITPVECLQNCEQGCSVAMRGPGRWTYVYGRFDPDTDVPILQEGAQRYALTSDGLIPWRERPLHLRKNCIARIPPLTLPVPRLGEF
ncbi:DUF1636 family protein [Roseobacter sp. HKCCD8198]|uniref:DUF1636 family protein n=2 Tax=unclassified Roseobacter TaxID=196798 RepID=UPI00345F8062